MAVVIELPKLRARSISYTSMYVISNLFVAPTGYNFCTTAARADCNADAPLQKWRQPMLTPQDLRQCEAVDN